MSDEMYPVTGGMSHVAVVVADLDQSEKFYVDKLRLPVIRRHDDERGRHRSTWVRLGSDGFLAIERGRRSVQGRDDDTPGLHCLALRIRAEDRRFWREHLERNSIAIERESAFTIYVRDPDGVLVGLSHYPEEKSPAEEPPAEDQNEEPES